MAFLDLDQEFGGIFRRLTLAPELGHAGSCAATRCRPSAMRRIIRKARKRRCLAEPALELTGLLEAYRA